MTLLIDPSVLGQYRDVMGADGDAFIKDLVQTFLEDAEKLTETMAQALTSGDRETFQRSAHTLKTSVATMGAQALSMRFKGLEMESETQDLAGLEDELTLARQELVHVANELHKLFLE